MTTVDSPPEMR